MKEKECTFFVPSKAFQSLSFFTLYRFKPSIEVTYLLLTRDPLRRRVLPHASTRYFVLHTHPYF